MRKVGAEYKRKGGKNVTKRKWQSTLAALLAVCTVTSTGAPLSAFAETDAVLLADSAEAAETLAAEENALYYEQQISYSDYYEQYMSEARPNSSIEVRASSFTEENCETFEVGSYTGEEDGSVRDDVLIWNSASGSFTYDIEVPETGLYCVEASYCPIVSNTASIELSLAIDGETPYDAASRITLNKVFKNEKPIEKDSSGDEVRPSQIQTEMWQTADFKDPDGLFNEPIVFYLEKGSHTITLEANKGWLALEYLKFYNPEGYKTYDEYVASVDAAVTVEATPSATVRIEGESAVYKSDSVLYPTYDNSSCSISPADPRHLLYNTVGKGNWDKAQQTVTWDMTVPADGWYKMGIKARQEEMRGFFSNRRIYIDGEVLCEDMDQVRFYYDTDFHITEVETNEGEDLYIYLTAGEKHTLTMEAVPGAIGEYMRSLDDIVLDLNTYYRKIVMITGPEPDTYTDYYVHEKIPEIVDTFDSIAKELRSVQDEIESLANSEGSEAASLESMAIILEKCVKDPLKIPSYLSQIKDYITSISSWMRDYRDQPLEIDYIELTTADNEFGEDEAGFFDNLSYSFQRFIASFNEDYSSLTDTTGEDTIDVWVSLGRDQAQVVKQMVESEFIPEYNIPVSINLVVGGVVEATLADKGPDVSLFLGGEFPVNLACRGLLVDVSELSEFDEVEARYQEEAMVPYEYEGGTYGMPLTRSWAMMFYRKDVLSELGFTAPPETWTELIDMLPALQRSYMSAGLVLPAVAADSNMAQISPATESGHTFATLMLQQGTNYYNDTFTETMFNTNEAIDAFEMWTSFYTKYDFDQQYDGFSRFRTGEYPIVIADYTFYNQLQVAAPEIKGLWDFTTIPGTEQEDGTISHAVNSASSGAVIFNKVAEKENGIENAWTFLKWFGSAETQIDYATQIEGLMGQLGRYAPANTAALEQLAWSPEEVESLETAMDELVEVPIIPASYAVTRNVMNAFREVVNNSENPRDTLMWYNRDINEEITRKRENLGLDTAE